MTDQERVACLNANPEIASLDLTPDLSGFSMNERKALMIHPHPAYEDDDWWPNS